MSDIVIVGGGLAGGSAAVRLARAGRRVQLFEREHGPHDKVCGEFLSIEAQTDLKVIGVDPLTLGAVVIDRVRVIGRGKTIESILPFTALSLSRKMLDQALLDLARENGAEVHCGVKVSEIQLGAVTSNLGTTNASSILLASGKHDVRTAPRLTSGIKTDYVGFKTHWEIDTAQVAELDSAVELVWFDGGYAGIQRVSERTLNLCVVIRNDYLSCNGNSWNGILSRLMEIDHVARRLSNARPLFERPLSIARLPYGYIHHPSDDMAGMYRLGDQAAVTAPLTGDGMSIALRSASLAAKCIEGDLSVRQYTEMIRNEVSSQVSRAMTLHRAANSPRLMKPLLSVLQIYPNILSFLASRTRLKE